MGRIDWSSRGSCTRLSPGAALHDVNSGALSEAREDQRTNRMLAHAILDVPLDSEDELNGEEDAKDDNRDIDKELEVPITMRSGVIRDTDRSEQVMLTRAVRTEFQSAAKLESACAGCNDVRI